MEDKEPMNSNLQVLEHKFHKRERLERADFPAFCSYGPIGSNDPYKWQGVIFGPPGSPFEDGVFFLSIDLPYDYPLKPPKIMFMTKIFHPNVDEDGTIYVDILEEEEWKPIQTIETLLVSICSLLADPNPVHSFNHSSFLYLNNFQEFNKIAREWTKTHAMLN